MRIGAMQMRLSTDLKTNLKTIENWLVKAADHGVEILNFPETCLTGYLFDYFSDVKNDDITSSIDYLSGLSREKGVSIIVGTPFWDNNRCFNSVAVLLADGRRYMYHKINLVSYSCIFKRDSNLGDVIIVGYFIEWKINWSVENY